MELSGSLSDNLTAAIASARRLRGHPVYSDTMAFWRNLLAFARERQRRRRSPSTEDTQLIAELQEELAVREQQG